ncbi:MAG: aldehyde dehydrogenase family protein [Gemmatimonadota bacterium]
MNPSPDTRTVEEPAPGGTDGSPGEGHRFAMTIGGESVRGAEARGVVNPASGTEFAEVPECSRSELDAAMAAAQEAFPTWSRNVDSRREALLACAQRVTESVDRLAPYLTREQGKPLEKASGEIIGASVWLKYTAGLEIPVEVVQDDEKFRAEIHRKPLGVVAAITPWNYPLLLAMWKLAPALLAGNTVVLKPSPYTPVTSLLLGDLLRDILPPGVLNVVSGGDELGSWMTRHPVPRKISFTGSVATGKKVALAAAPDLKRVTLELGGNDAAILLPDLDAAEVADKIFWGAFENTGQVCNAIKRVYVPASQYASFVNRIAEVANNTKVGDGLEEGTQLGPLSNEAQLERVAELVERARRSGATIVTGGERLSDRGYFYAPTVVSDISDDEPLVAEEQFGPALPVLPYGDVDEAVARANATRYGLSGSVWSSDPERGAEVAGRLECGTAWVNQHIAVRPNLPISGAKWSGIGVENGPWGLLDFTEIQTVSISKRSFPGRG